MANEKSFGTRWYERGSTTLLAALAALGLIGLLTGNIRQTKGSFIDSDSRKWTYSQGLFRGLICGQELASIHKDTTTTITTQRRDTLVGRTEEDAVTQEYNGISIRYQPNNTTVFNKNGCEQSFGSIKVPSLDTCVVFGDERIPITLRNTQNMLRFGTQRLGEYVRLSK